MHHQSLIGMNIEEAKQAFLNLIQCWPLHKATLFDVAVSPYYWSPPFWAGGVYWQMFFYTLAWQQSFTSNWPKTMWLAVDQRGVHLLEFRSRNVLTSYEYDSILDYTPSVNHILLITGNDKKQSKIIVTTNQVTKSSEGEILFVDDDDDDAGLNKCDQTVSGFSNRQPHPRIHPSAAKLWRRRELQEVPGCPAGLSSLFSSALQWGGQRHVPHTVPTALPSHQRPD